MRPMLPPRDALVLVDPRRPAELAHHHHQGTLQQAALVEINQQRGQCVIEDRQAPAHAIGTIAEGAAHAHLGAVHVPARAGRAAARLTRSRSSPAVHGDEPDSGLDQPSRQE